MKNKAKDLLNNLYWESYLLEQKLSTLQELKERLYTLQHDLKQVGIVITGARADAGFTRLVERIYDLLKEIVADTESFLSRRNEISRDFESLGDVRHSTVLYMHYIGHQPFTDIANCLGFSYDLVMKLHAQALSALDEKLTSGEILKKTRKN